MAMTTMTFHGYCHWTAMLHLWHCQDPAVSFVCNGISESLNAFHGTAMGLHGTASCGTGMGQPWGCQGLLSLPWQGHGVVIGGAIWEVHGDTMGYSWG